ncbi:MAG: rhizoferrin biosystnesis N-citrylornithine decarboxylase FslC [Planctomycetota bacterium]
MNMERPRYERPTMVRNVVGRMNKAGMRAELSRAGSAIDEVPIERLCSEFGSPLFVFSERRLRKAVRRAKEALQRQHPKARLCCSYKTNYLGAICAIQHQEGSLAEVVSGVEYEQARRLCVGGEDIVFNGPWKTRDELERAFAEGAIVHADSFDEIFAAERIAADRGIEPRLGIRVGLDAGIYPRWDRFGFDLSSGEAMQAVRRIAKGGRLRFGGLHTHIGTYVLDAKAYGRAAAQLSSFAGEVESQLGVRPTHLDLGGGFASSNTLASQYQAGSLSPPIEAYAEAIGAALLGEGEKKAPLLPLLAEPGRAIVDEAGTLVTTVVSQKRLADGRRALVVDAGVNLLFTAWWYRLNVQPAKAVEGVVEDTAVFGPLCMNIDCLRQSVPLPNLRPGDRLTVHPVGAYAFTQSMQFIRLRPAVVLIGEDGRPELIRRAEVVDDLTGPERVPDRLLRRRSRDPARAANGRDGAADGGGEGQAARKARIP